MLAVMINIQHGENVQEYHVHATLGNIQSLFDDLHKCVKLKWPLFGDVQYELRSGFLLHLWSVYHLTA